MCRFDSCLKKTVFGVVKDYYKELKKNQAEAIPFCELPDIIIDKVAIWDTYKTDYTTFNICGHDIYVYDDELAKVIKQLSDRYRENVLMYYFLDMSDTEIAKLQNISRSGVFQNRHYALKQMKKSLEEEHQYLKQKRSYKKPSFYVLSSAMDGDKISIDKILDFYDPYISKSCIRPLYDEYGNVYIAVDMELKGRIREAIMKMILEFDIKIEQVISAERFI